MTATVRATSLVHVVPTAMPPGGNVVDVDQRNELAWVNVAVATLRTGLTEFGPGGTLRFANPRFGELFGLAPPHPPAGARLSTLLDQMATREEFAEAEGARCIAAQREADRSCPSVARRIRADGQVIGIVSDPLPDGGWALTVTDISALARAEDDASGQAALMRSILEAIPHASAFTARIVG